MEKNLRDYLPKQLDVYKRQPLMDLANGSVISPTSTFGVILYILITLGLTVMGLIYSIKMCIRDRALADVEVLGFFIEAKGDTIPSCEAVVGIETKNTFLSYEANLATSKMCIRDSSII